MTVTSDPRIMIPMIRKVMPTLMAQQIVGVQPMTAYTGSLFETSWTKEYNKKYWPYQYVVTQYSRYEVERWCWERFKGRYWSNYGNKFVFKRDKDAVLFALRWA